MSPSIYRWQLAAFVVILSAAAVWAGIGRGPNPPPPAEVARPLASQSPRVAQAEPETAPHPLKGNPDSRVRECQAALKKIATALEMYASDHEGRYPGDLKELVPVYLAGLPQCPTAGRDTYRAGFTTGQSALHNDHDWKDFYHLACSGHHHDEADLDPNMPALNCALGLLPDMPFQGTPQQARTICGENLKVIATSLEMYSVDNGGHYPKSLSVLGATYLPKVPRCPATGQDTYSSTFKIGRSAPDNPDDYPEYYYLECSGAHAGANPPGGPCYDSVRGLRDRQ